MRRIIYKYCTGEVVYSYSIGNTGFKQVYSRMLQILQYGVRINRHTCNLTVPSTYKYRYVRQLYGIYLQFTCTVPVLRTGPYIQNMGRKGRGTQYVRVLSILVPVRTGTILMVSPITHRCKLNIKRAQVLSTCRLLPLNQNSVLSIYRYRQYRRATVAYKYCMITYRYYTCTYYTFEVQLQWIPVVCYTFTYGVLVFDSLQTVQVPYIPVRTY